MADIKEKIYKSYGIDIDADKDIIVKKYKFSFDNDNFSDSDIEDIIAKAKSRWQKTVDSGTMEKQIEEAKKRLEESPKYEKLFRDKKLRVELWKYYNSNSNSDELNFAKEYFAIIESTKKLCKEDVDFYIKCFPEDRKKKKAIIEMLNSVYKIKLVSKEESEEDNKKEANKKDTTAENIIVNMFSQETVRNIIELDKKYKEAQSNKNIYDRYPDLAMDISDFLKIGTYKNFDEFSGYINKCKKDAFTIKQDFGNDYGLVVDVYNIMDELLNVKKHKDVHDNFDQFKVLLYYPNLTPYMYPLENAKKNTLDLLFKAAKNTQNYGFKNIEDFINSYYVLVYENFNIDDSSISSMLKNAKKKAKKVLKDLEKNRKEKSGGTRFTGFNILYALAFWPLFLLFFIYEIIKNIIWHLKKVSIIAFIPFFILNAISVNNSGYGIGLFADIFNNAGRQRCIETVTGVAAMSSFQTVVLSIASVVFLLNMYLCLPTVVTYICYQTSSKLKKRFDWIGLEKTLKSLLAKNKERFSDLNKISNKMFISKIVTNIIANIVYTALIVTVLVLGIGYLSLLKPEKEIEQEPVVEEIVEEVELTPEELWKQELADLPSFNGHKYKVFTDSMSWDEAEKFCEDKGGHIVTITSEEEQKYVSGIISDDKYYWIDAEIIGNNDIKWTTDELFIYANWEDKAPGGKASEKHVAIHSGSWTELPDKDEITVSGFVFEYEPEFSGEITWYKVLEGKNASLRSGPGKNNDLIFDAKSDVLLMGTGNSEINDAGNEWYEIYLDNFHNEKAFVYSGNVEEIAK